MTDAAIAKRLTPRELETLQALASGATASESARAMRCSRRTISAHRDAIVHVTGISGIARLTRFAVRAGVVEA